MHARTHARTYITWQPKQAGHNLVNVMFNIVCLTNCGVQNVSDFYITLYSTAASKMYVLPSTILVCNCSVQSVCTYYHTCIQLLCTKCMWFPHYFVSICGIQNIYVPPPYIVCNCSVQSKCACHHIIDASWLNYIVFVSGRVSRRIHFSEGRTKRFTGTVWYL